MVSTKPPKQGIELLHPLPLLPCPLTLLASTTMQRKVSAWKRTHHCIRRPESQEKSRKMAAL
eukprot:5945603-Amphidinium_carterae.1